MGADPNIWVDERSAAGAAVTIADPNICVDLAAFGAGCPWTCIDPEGGFGLAATAFAGAAGAAAVPAPPNICVDGRSCDGAGAGAPGTGGRELVPAAPGAGGAAGVPEPKSCVLFVSGLGGTPGGMAVNTCPQRVHWTGAPPAGINRSSSAYVVPQRSHEICTMTFYHTLSEPKAAGHTLREALPAWLAPRPGRHPPPPRCGIRRAPFARGPAPGPGASPRLEGR